MTSLNTLESVIGPDLKYILLEMEEIFPATTPTPDWPTNMIMYKSGQRSVVEWLQQRISQDNVF